MTPQVTALDEAADRIFRSDILESIIRDAEVGEIYTTFEAMAALAREVAVIALGVDDEGVI